MSIRDKIRDKIGQGEGTVQVGAGTTPPLDDEQAAAAATQAAAQEAAVEAQVREAATAVFTAPPVQPQVTPNAPAVAQQTAVAQVSPLRNMIAFAHLENAMPSDMVAALALDSPRIKGEQGSLYNGNEDMGKKLRLQPVSWNKRWTVSTGTDDAEAKEKFKVSYDGVMIHGTNTTVAAYLDELKAQGYKDAKLTVYVDIWGLMQWCEKKGEIPLDQQSLTMLQCAPTSAGKFINFCTTRGLLESRGLAKPLEVIEVHAEAQAKGSNKWTNFSFHVPPAPAQQAA